MKRAVGPEEPRRILALQDVVDQWHDDGCAPWTGDKGQDLAVWLAAHSDKQWWAVIDDDELWPVGDPRGGQHVRPDFVTGPQPPHWEALEEALTRETR